LTNQKQSQIIIEDLTIEVTKKPVKNIRLLVNIHEKNIRIIAPIRLKLDNIRVFAESKILWIKKQLSKIVYIKPNFTYQYITWEIHSHLGKKYTLSSSEVSKKPKVLLWENVIYLHININSTYAQRKFLLESWQRKQLKNLIPEYIEKWEQIMKVQVKDFWVKKMKTRWWTCNPRAHRIWLTLELIHQPIECIEYVIVHEMTHLLERWHRKKFIALMDRFLPQWREYKKVLNQTRLWQVD